MGWFMCSTSQGCSILFWWYTFSRYFQNNEVGPETDVILTIFVSLINFSFFIKISPFSPEELTFDWIFENFYFVFLDHIPIILFITFSTLWKTNFWIFKTKKENVKTIILRFFSLLKQFLLRILIFSFALLSSDLGQ